MFNLLTWLKIRKSKRYFGPSNYFGLLKSVLAHPSVDSSCIVQPGPLFSKIGVFHSKLPKWAKLVKFKRSQHGPYLHNYKWSDIYIEDAGSLKSLSLSFFMVDTPCQFAAIYSSNVTEKIHIKKWNFHSKNHLILSQKILFLVSLKLC